MAGNSSPFYFCFFRNSWIASVCSDVGVFRPPNQALTVCGYVPIARAISDWRPYFLAHQFCSSASNLSVLVAIEQCLTQQAKITSCTVKPNGLNFTRKKNPPSARTPNGSITVKLIRALPMSSIYTFLWGVKNFHSEFILRGAQ